MSVGHIRTVHEEHEIIELFHRDHRRQLIVMGRMRGSWPHWLAADGKPLMTERAPKRKACNVKRDKP